MEIVVRLYYTVSVRFEPGVGYVNAPGTVRWSREGHGETRWTDHGVRADTPPDLTQPSVLVLGDSFTEALQVDQDESFSAGLAHALRRYGISVINAGRSTVSTADYVALAPHYQQLFHPRWVVFALNEHDLTDDSFQALPGRTHFRLRDDGDLDLISPDTVARQGLSMGIWAIRQKVMLVGYGFVRAGDFREATLREPALFRAGNAVPPPATLADDYPVEAELGALRRAWSDRLTILYLSDFDPLHPDRSSSSVEPRLFAYCATNHLSCVSLRSQFADLVRRGLAPYGFANSNYNQGHMNRNGHSVAARALVVELTGPIQSAIL
jgi:hypothetical protein